MHVDMSEMAPSIVNPCTSTRISEQLPVAVVNNSGELDLAGIDQYKGPSGLIQVEENQILESSIKRVRPDSLSDYAEKRFKTQQRKYENEERIKQPQEEDIPVKFWDGISTNVSFQKALNHDMHEQHQVPSSSAEVVRHDSVPIQKSKNQCLVNQESYELQTGQGWQSRSQPQLMKVPGPVSGKPSNVRQQSNAAIQPPARPMMAVMTHTRTSTIEQLMVPNFQMVSPVAASVPHSASNTPENSKSQMSKDSSAVLERIIHKKAAEHLPPGQPPSKKQKVIGCMLDQSLDQLNDVTTVSGVNLREEEEQLLPEPMEWRHALDSMRKFVQEEEHQMFLEKEPLRQKVLAIAAKCGVSNVSENAERCLSMSLEEWFRNLLFKLIRFSKRRCEVEKERHNVMITSNPRQRILLMKKAQETIEQKMRERISKRSKKVYKDVGDKGVSRAEPKKARKGTEEKTRVDTTNLSARLAAGVDDMLIKWQIMAEQGRLKREGEAGASNGATDRENRKSFAGMPPDGKGAHGDVRVWPGSVLAKPNIRGPRLEDAAGRLPGEFLSDDKSENPEVVHYIALRDLIAVLEREPQMAKSILLYQLYDRNATKDSECA